MIQLGKLEAWQKAAGKAAHLSIGLVILQCWKER
jgi:hypothetical protein